MIERIVVPLDGSITAEAILPQVRRILYRNDSEVILVRAVIPPPIENAMLVLEGEIGAAKEYVAGQVEKLRNSGVRVRAVVHVGSPIAVILEVVKEEKATLVALATHGARGLKRLLFGSVAEGVIRKSPVPVLLVRPFWSYEMLPQERTEQRPIRNLLLPVDGSELSLQAVPGVMELADLFETRVVLQRVLGPKKPKSDPVKEEAEARTQLEGTVKSMGQKGVETIPLLTRGDPAAEILKAAEAQEIDLIAMTTHGRSGLSRAVAGSVTETVLRKAVTPVLVFPNAAYKKAARKPKVTHSR